MAAAVTWGIKSATFTPTGGTLETFTDLTDIKFDDSINLQDLLTDSAVNVSLVFGTGGKVEVSLTSTDTSTAWRTTSVPGTSGVLVLVFGKRASGKGYIAAADKTLTSQAAGATLSKRSGDGSAASAGSAEFSFTIVDPAQTGVFFTVS